ncbi:MAG: hypothetical protein IKE60_09110 [Reyranella sp.]|uniref:hypothetical protein n=1 Tax=Reyranella sp. TaxID=1929291 RepID=UPI0025D4A4DD|nr:hypothetical protein [Reyranella sp.]MBR2814795.1 hypothetical protein [Reyranella sp.]
MRTSTREVSLFTALIIGAIVIVGFGVPAFMWLTKLIRPPKPEEEAIHRGVAAARKAARDLIDRPRPH